MNNTLLDNSTDFRMVRYIKDLLNNPQCTELKIATGYWDLPGTKLVFDELKSFFDRGGKFDLLIGQEPMLRSYMMTEEAAKVTFPDFYLQRDVDKVRDEYKEVVQLLADHINSNDEDKAQLRVHVYGQREPKQFLHAKCYIFLGRGFAHGIIGSSNFTQKGLEENAELNYLETENSVVIAPDSIYSNSKSHLTWFMEKWNESDPWTGKFIQILTGGTTPPPVDGPDVIVETAGLTPYEVYIRLLQDRFGMVINDSMTNELRSYLPKKYDEYEYQFDAVKQCYQFMNVMGGFMLADVVGLGKTVVGLLLARYFLEHEPDPARKRVLIVTPPAIQSSWKDTIEDFDPDGKLIKPFVDYVTTGSIENLNLPDDLKDGANDYENQNEDGVMDGLDDNKIYGLILIDESHKFRNNSTQMYQSLYDFIGRIWSKTAKYPYIGLISATPQNNRPKDLQNQILLFEHSPKASKFEGPDIVAGDFDDFFKKINAEYDVLIHQPDSPKTRADLRELSAKVRTNVLEHILVRRTRNDILKHYSSNKLVFPDTVGPVELDYVMSPKLAKLFADTMDAIGRDGTLKYHRYRAIEHLKLSIKRRYEFGSMSAEKSANALASIMQTSLVKRLESSFDAFRTSLNNLKHATDLMIQMWDDNCFFICPDIDVIKELDINEKRKTRPMITLADCYDDIRKIIVKRTADGKNLNNRNAEYKTTDFNAKSTYYTDLLADQKVLDKLVKDWNSMNEDPKLKEFETQLVYDIMIPDSMRLQNHINRLNSIRTSDNATLVDAELTRLKEIADKIEKQNVNSCPHCLGENDGQGRDAFGQKLVIFSEAVDTVNKVVEVCKRCGFRVLKITAAELGHNRKHTEQIIRENFDASYDGEWKDDYDIIVTSEVLAEGVNLHRAHAILNYDTPWNATRLIQRIGRINRIKSSAKAIFVYNFYPSSEGDDLISLVQKAYTKLQAFHVMFGEDNRIFSQDEELVSYNIVVNGEDSAFEPFISELKDFQKSNPDRYNQLLLMEKLQIATPVVSIVDNSLQVQETLCEVKDHNAEQTRFYVSIDPAKNGKAITTLDMFNRCKCAKNSISVALPDNITEIEEVAIQEYWNSVNNISTKAKADSRVKDALMIISEWQKDAKLSETSKDLLSKAKSIIRGGNVWLAKRILDLNSTISSSTLVPMTQDEIDKNIQDSLRMVSDNSNKEADPFIFITFDKQ